MTEFFLFVTTPAGHRFPQITNMSHQAVARRRLPEGIKAWEWARLTHLSYSIGRPGAADTFKVIEGYRALHGLTPYCRRNDVTIFNAATGDLKLLAEGAAIEDHFNTSHEAYTSMCVEYNFSRRVALAFKYNYTNFRWADEKDGAMLYCDGVAGQKITVASRLKGQPLRILIPELKLS